MCQLGFPDGSASKESACSAGDTGDVGSISGLRWSLGEGNIKPLQYSCLKNPWTEEPGAYGPWVVAVAWHATVWWVVKSDMAEQLST